eukprot:4339349-Pleurochrysis_carterae.AAC.1
MRSDRATTTRQQLLECANKTTLRRLISSARPRRDFTCPCTPAAKRPRRPLARAAIPGACMRRLQHEPARLQRDIDRTL